LTDDVRAFMDEWWARLCARGVSGAFYTNVFHPSPGFNI
jgi:hypothetical protein